MAGEAPVPPRRALDGVFPLLKGQADTETMTPEQLSEIVAYTQPPRADPRST